MNHCKISSAWCILYTNGLSGDRLRNFKIFLSDTPPRSPDDTLGPLLPSDISGVKTCYHWPGTGSANNDVDEWCNTAVSGRYLSIEIMEHGRLNVCELEAFCKFL